MSRHRIPVVRKADLDRALDCLRRAGVQFAEVEVFPGKVRLVTTQGRALNVPEDNAELDAELAEHRARHGDGRA